VLANGTRVTASASENPSLFWALRGAGPSFGITTSLSFQTFLAPESNIMFSITYNVSTPELALKVFTGLQAYSEAPVEEGGMPKEMNARYFLNQQAIRTGRFSLTGVFHGTRDEYEQALPGLFERTGDPVPTRGSPQILGWMDALLENGNVWGGELEPAENYGLVTVSGVWSSGQTVLTRFCLQHETFVCDFLVNYRPFLNILLQFAKSLMTSTISTAAWESFIDYCITKAATVNRVG
jgi:hypothetical protein